MDPCELTERPNEAEFMKQAGHIYLFCKGEWKTWEIWTRGDIQTTFMNVIAEEPGRHPSMGSKCGVEVSFHRFLR
jgi:hypothetical protein